MAKLYFVQTMRAGPKQAVTIDRPDFVVAKADTITLHGFWFGAIADDAGALTLTIEDAGNVYAAEVCETVRQIGVAVDKLILGFDIATALKKRITP